MFEKDEDYRKARKESKDRITKVIKVWNAREETLHDASFIKGAEFGYNKANERHYVKDGDLPKDNNEKLCFYRKGAVVARYDSEYGCWETYFNNLETVIPSSVIIAWKEIEEPEPPKENK